MGRLLVLVMAALLLAGFATTGQAAGYEVETSVVLRASDSTVTQGETVTLSGRVVGARLGTQILLQRRVGGTWQTVKTRRLRDTRRYSFLARPPRGVQRFRVVKPRQLGQLRSVSRALAIRVQWVPGLTATADSRSDGSGGQVLSVSGRVSDGPTAPLVLLEGYDGTTWTVLAEKVLASADSDYAFEETVSAGQQYRVRLAGTDLTLERTSATFGHSYTPHLAEMNTQRWYSFRAGQARDAIEFDVEAGELVTLNVRTSSAVGVYSPSGEFVGAPRPYPESPMRFEAVESGRYRLEIRAESYDYEFWLAVSIPKVVETSVDAPAVTVSSDVEGQPVDVRFDATGTRAFTVPNSASTGETVTLVDGRGDVVEPWLPAGEPQGREPVYRPGDGVYSLRIAPENGNVSPRDVRPLAAHWVQGEVNGPFAKAVIDVPDRVVLVEYDEADEAVQVGADAGPYESIDFGVFDTATGVKNPTGPGGRVAAVAGGNERLTTTVDVQLSTPLHVDADVDGDPVQIDLTDNLRRVVAIHFTGRAGQPIYEERVSTAGSLQKLGVTTADGTVVTDLRRAATRGLWILPEDGEYILEVRADGYEQRVTKGTVRLLLAPTVELLGDGTPVTVTIDKPNQLIVGVVPMPSGTVFEATLDNLSEGLSPDPETRNWDVELKAPADGSWYNGWRKPGTLIPYTVREPGDIVAIISAEVTGSLRLRFDPRE